MMDSWVAERRKLVGERQQDMHVLPAHGCSPWDHMCDLIRLSGMEESAYQSYSERVQMVKSIYEEAKSRKPQLPWDDDSYRRYEYSVDWSNQTYTVKGPEASSSD